MSGNDDILTSLEDGIKTITINLPNKLNALSADNALRMAKEVEKSEEDGTRVIVVTGAGGAFCAGADLMQKGFERLGQPDAPTEQFMDELFVAIAPGTALILGVADNVMPDAKIERIRRITQLVDQRGTYPMQ